ncbi:hypothetical protein OHA21_13190 [Actinoplanes sp. NBC_00393]|uniref:hypothetical protein n=1 Tax=Actinoplanes sp. NBC_00393 TaxID=2975953 RepID=UPI002E2264E3
MTRTAAIRELLQDGARYDAARLIELAGELDLPLADVLVLAGRPVPSSLLPPQRKPEVVREFAYRVTFGDHPHLAALAAFARSLAPPPGLDVPDEVTAAAPGTDRFPEILAAFLRNRGMGLSELPFTGLSRATIRGMLGGGWHNLQQLKAMAGPLGWRYADLAAVAGEPLGPVNDCSTMCHHVGKVYVAAIPLTTGQLIQVAEHADRLSGRQDRGAWQPWAQRTDTCPDGEDPYRPLIS